MRARARVRAYVRTCVRRQTRGVVTYEWRETCGARKLERGNDTVVSLNHLLIESNRVVVLMRTRVGTMRAHVNEGKGRTLCSNNG